jgi:hypothetical protein
LRKSLAIIASALLLAVAAATHDRLRYDSSVFADAAVAGAEQAKRVEYPACIKGVREDRCIQLYERGVKRSYQRWLAGHGRGGAQVAAAQGPQRVYPRCRGRNDDRCQQVRATRTAARARPAQRRAAARAAAARRAPAHSRAAQSRAATRTAVRQQRRAAPVRQRQATRSPATRSPAPTRPRPGGGTPGI